MENANTQLARAEFAKGLEHHRAARLGEAKVCYEKVLALLPGNPDTLRLLGLLLVEAEHYHPAAVHLEQYLRQRPDDAAVLHALGASLLRLNLLPAAAQVLGKALQLRPGHPETQLELAALAMGENRNGDAELLLRQCLATQPANARALRLLGDLHRIAGNTTEALRTYELSCSANKGYAEAWCNLGNLLAELERRQEAVLVFENGLKYRPDCAQLHNNYAVVLRTVGKPREAIEAFQRALALFPDYCDALGNLALSLMSLNRLEEAELCCRKAITLEPGNPEHRIKLSNALLMQGDSAQAVLLLREILKQEPDNPNARYNLAHALLLQGQFEEGGRLFEARWAVLRKDGMRRFTQPCWDGSQDIRGKTLFIHAEHGLGDTLQFMRYVPLLAAAGARVLLEVQPPLARLFRSLDGVSNLSVHGDATPQVFDLHCPSMSLPYAFKSRVEDIPANTPYLKAEPDRIHSWKQRLHAESKPCIGLAWSGNPLHANDANRSLSLADFIPLLEAFPELRFCVMQKNIRAEDRVLMHSQPRLLDLSQDFPDFAETAAAAEALDLIISVDTSVAHLCGALRRPVWLLLPFCPDWRWLLNRDDSPWYPEMRLFRQPRPGDWTTVFGRLHQELKAQFEIP